MMVGSSEDIVVAAKIIRDASEKTAFAANQISEAIDLQRRFMDDWLARFSEAIVVATQKELVVMEP